MRFYFEGADDAFHAIRACIVAAGQESFHICEVRVQPGYLIGQNRTRCDVRFHLSSRLETDERYQKMTKNGSSIKISVGMIGGIFEGKLSEDGKPIIGTWTQGTKPLPLTLVRASSSSEADTSGCSSDV